MRRFSFLPFLLLGVALVPAAEYTFTALPDSGYARIEVKIDRPLTEFRLPAWAPGDYDLLNYGRFVGTIEFSRSGAKAEFERTSDPNLWRIPGGADRVVYETKPPRGNFSVNLRIAENHTFVSGSGVFGWFEGDQRSRQTLRIRRPAGTTVYTTLDRQAGDSADIASFTAYDFDEMIDAPFVYGSAVKAENFEVHGKPMSIVGFNRVENADLSGYVKLGKATAEACYNLFGELPFPRYIFFLDFGGGGGGLEHLNSTRIGVGGRAAGPGSGGILFHEFFHCFNVKRIRERPLGPFDYTKPAICRTIWWLEGVTDYYADVNLFRSGQSTREATVAEWAGSLAGFGQNPNRLKVSAEEASLRVWETRGSFGFGGISYYEKGKLVGLCLDLAIRGHSKGKASLDDVMRQLYQECKERRPGYVPERIRELCVKYGGPELGTFYDVCAKVSVDLPVDEAARAAGLIWDGKAFSADSMALPSIQAIGAKWPLPVGANQQEGQGG